MNEKFTASNGLTLWGDQDGVKIKPIIDTGMTLSIDELTANALHEYFQTERDKELGRWRDPKIPNRSVYRDKGGDRPELGRCVRVVDERHGTSVEIWEKGCHDGAPFSSREIAGRYFGFHPEPKPWHDAEYGEVWALEVEGEQAKPFMFYQDSTFIGAGGENFSPDWAEVTAGRRIWPEGD